MYDFYPWQKGYYNEMLITGVKGGTYELVFNAIGKASIRMSLKNVFTGVETEIAEELLLEKFATKEIWPVAHPYWPSAKWLKSIGEGVEEVMEEVEEVEG